MATQMSATPQPATNGKTHARGSQGTTSTDATATPTPSVNRKKQKRREKQAARLAAEHHDAYGSGHADLLATDEQRSGDDDHEYEPSDRISPVTPGHYGYESPHQHPRGLPMTNEADDHHASGETSKRKKNRKSRSNSHHIADRSSTPHSTPSATFSHHQSLPYISRFTGKPMKNSSIWNQSTLEERENIRTFWFELGEEERRQLVKVEKDAVLKKMKEQQKHSCSCTVCGRKRTAIEEELEVLYDAYYEELEQYANNNQGAFDEGAPIIPPPRLYQPPLRSPGQHTRTQGQFHPSRSRVQELPDDDEVEEEYDEEEEDDDEEDDEDEDEEDEEELYSDEDMEDDEARAARADFFAFGNSLTVKDGILTVADDLLKNDGKHFIDMMEQLAERRMQREEDTQYGMAAHQSYHGHNHGPLDDEDYDDEEDDEDYDSQEEEEFDEDEMDAMTEEQRMQEGRRMFQIFAARMFEQRVMTAYREKVAEQRQKQLIDELLQEETLNEQRNAKKAREAQKKKDRKRLQKLQKEEERARREALKAAEEADLKAAQEQKAREQRQKREEQRKKREAERKAQEEERARKEAEKQRRLKEERERQAEAERKQREQKEEKKRREEARRKEKEEQEKKAKEERERKMREEQAKKERDAAREQEIRDRSGKREQVRTSPPHTLPGVIPYNVQSQPPGLMQSPHHHMAIPVLPKASTPGRPRQQSHHGSSASSPHSQPSSADPSHHPSISPRSMGHSQSGPNYATRQAYQQPPLHHPQPSAPLSPLGRPTAFSGFTGLPFNPPGISGMAPRSTLPPESFYSSNAGMINPMRPFNGTGGIPAPPGMNGVRPIPPARAFPVDPGHGNPFAGNHGVTGAIPLQQTGLSKPHSRQPSTSFDRSPLDTGTQPFPITRPSPIKRPSSSAQNRQNNDNVSVQREVDGLSAHLGSSALLDDTDAAYPSNLSQSLPGAPAPGLFPGPTRASFQGPSLFTDSLGSPQTNFAMGSPMGNHHTWGSPFGGSAFPGTPSGWGPASAGTGWPHNNAFAAPSGHHRPHTSRPVTIRLLAIQACKQLDSMTSPPKGSESFHDVNLVLSQVEQLRSPSQPPISLDELLDICDTEGSPQNGGGSFSIKDTPNEKSVLFEPDPNSAVPGHRGSIVPGDIGSPVPSNSHPAPFSAFGGPSVLRQYSSPQAGLFGGSS